MVANKISNFGGLVASFVLIPLMFLAVSMSTNFLITSKTFAYDGESFDHGSDVFKNIEGQRGYPVRRMSSKAVIAKFGEPQSRNDPVGDPPISIWFYNDFRVYFEHHLVITTVAVKDRLPTELKDIQ